MFRLLMIFLLCSTILLGKQPADFNFLGWEKKHKLNYEAFESDAHNAYLDIYVNELAKEAYIKEKSLFPVGSIIYKPLYNDPMRKIFAKLVLMVKMKPGYDTKNGDWWYGVYDKSGTEMYYQGKLKSCIRCHEAAKATDYTFSKSVNANIDRLLFNSKRSWKK